jgi:acetyl esterase/lipase
MAIVETQGVGVEQDVVFGRGGSRDLLCDVYRPAPGRQKHVAVIHLHGGGFRVGSKAGTRLARPLAARGYTCVSSSYRLADEATWPAQIQDVKTCIRWIRANAGRLDVDATKVVVLGYSAGGHLALIAAGSQNKPEFEGDGGQPGLGTEVAACVAFYPPAGGGGLGRNPVLGPDPGAELVRSFSPIDYIAAGFPPTLLLHGTADQTVPVEDSVRLYQALREVGAPVELHLVEGVTHIFDRHDDLAEASALWIDLFLDRHVVDPRTYPSTEPGR